MGMGDVLPESGMWKPERTVSHYPGKLMLDCELLRGKDSVLLTMTAPVPNYLVH